MIEETAGVGPFLTVYFPIVKSLNYSSSLKVLAWFVLTIFSKNTLLNYSIELDYKLFKTLETVNAIDWAIDI